jgi:hypothetical protein
LSDAEKGQLVSIWILAADRNGLIPDDPVLIQKLCYLSDAVNLRKFISFGFLCQDGVNMASSWRQHDAPEAEAEAEAEAEKELCSFENFWKTFSVEYGSKGSKKKAKAQYLKTIKSKPEDFLIGKVIEQMEHKRMVRQSGEWAPDFPHVKRWLRDERWEDEIPPTKAEIEKKETEDAKRRFLAKPD